MTKYYNLFNDTSNLVAAKDIKELMEFPEPPKQCLCGQCHFEYSTFTPEAQQRTYRRTGKFRAFFSPKHVKIYKQSN